MAKILYPSLRRSWFKCLSSICQQCSFSSQIKGSWNDPPICPGRVIDKKDKKCHPKSDSCSGTLSACGIQQWPKCEEPERVPEKHLICCCDHRLSKPICDPPPRKKQKPIEKEEFKSMWETTDEPPLCPTYVPRLDDTHYHPTNKFTRVYTKTWETPGPVIRRKKFCDICDVCPIPPPYERRSKAEILELTAREQDAELLKVDYNLLRNCIENIPKNPNTTKINKCVKIVMPCCRKVPKNVKCRRPHGHSKCYRECCPYPSFSECEYPRLPKDKPDDCHCLDFTHQCHADRFLLRKNVCKLPPPLPGWPPENWRPK